MPAPSLARIIYASLGHQGVGQLLGNVVNQTKVICNNFPFSLIQLRRFSRRHQEKDEEFY